MSEEWVECVGWWEQVAFGRQPMLELVLRFQGMQVSGRGRDIVGEFRMDGVIRSNGEVQLHKQYIEQHTVLYVGHSDGEGGFAGRWVIDDCHGPWQIQIKRQSASGGGVKEIQELVPPPTRDIEPQPGWIILVG